MQRSRPHRSAIALLDRALLVAVAMLFLVVQWMVFAVRAHAEGSDGVGDPETAGMCERATGAHLEALLLKHRPHLLLLGPVTRPAQKPR